MDRPETVRPLFTPGPWERRGLTRVYGNRQRDQNDTADLVANTVRSSDARLIAAAPELYGALAEYMECVAFASNPDVANADVLTLKEASDRMVNARDRATAALAKARGES